MQSIVDHAINDVILDEAVTVKAISLSTIGEEAAKEIVRLIELRQQSQWEGEYKLAHIEV